LLKMKMMMNESYEPFKREIERDKESERRRRSCKETRGSYLLLKKKEEEKEEEKGESGKQVGHTKTPKHKQTQRN